MEHKGKIEPVGQLGITVQRSQSYLPESERGSLPKSMGSWSHSILSQAIRRAVKFLPDDLRAELVDRTSAAMIAESELRLSVRRADGRIEDYGVVAHHQVTADGVLWICSAMAAVASYDITSMKFHGLGTGGTAEAATDTILVTELTTQYNPDNTRATGTVAAAVSGNNATYQTVGTNTLDIAAAITEHGIFNRAANGARVVATNLLLDRSLFSVINLGIGDGMTSTYTLTVNSGG